MKKTICLNMIVKNESHIIEITLENILKYINIDYWVISDTGSSDNTIDIIKSFFKKNNIDGELYQDEWRDFAHNRTLALEYAFNKTDYIFIFDADDLIHNNIPIPTNMNKDGYHLNFEGYHRTCLVSNKHKWKYVGVVHEYIQSCDFNADIDFLHGDYYIQSRRLGSRNHNPNKYRDDGLILEKAIETETDIGLKNRYMFYCAQSFMDIKEYYDKAINYLKLFLESNGDIQHKFICCIRLASIYKKLNDIDNFLLYNSKSVEYDSNRLEGIVMNMQYYYDNLCHNSVNMYYSYFKNYNIDNVNLKLFYQRDKYEFFYYLNSISASYTNDKINGYECCKWILLNNISRWIGITLSNFVFYKEFFYKDINNDDLIKWFIAFIRQPTNTIEERKMVLNDYCNNEIIKNKYLNEFTEFNNIINVPDNIFKSDDYSFNKNILIYTGYMHFTWNDSTLQHGSLGGSEKAVIYLSRNLPKNYKIYIAGDQKEETKENITYISHNNLQHFLNTNEFHTVIVSRYVSFFKQFNNIKCYQLFLSTHDTNFINHAVKEFSTNDILVLYHKYIDNVICLTKWHSTHITNLYSFFSDKIKIINNGITISDFKFDTREKIKNKFIWSSCAGRGLHIILNIWDDILKEFPDATLDICSYESFPKNEEEINMKQIIDKYESIKHHGKLTSMQLYKLTSKSEFWLYTTNFLETSCITAMEMLMNEVICLYYPIAGLNDTIGDYGIKVNQGQEIQELLTLTTEKKALMRENGKKYALTCSWENRAIKWSNIIGMINNYNYNYNIHVINLEHRIDRKENMIEQFKKEQINNYKFVKAVYGNNIKQTNELQNLFQGNDFNYRKGVIGCALSHTILWKQLINDNYNDFYVILEDDVKLLPNFKDNLNIAVNKFIHSNYLHALIGGNNIYDDEADLHFKDNGYYKDNKLIKFKTEGTWGYILHKNGAKILINYINNNSIKYAIDHPDIFIKNTNPKFLNKNIITTNSVQRNNNNNNNNIDSDIQRNTDSFEFNNSNNILDEYTDLFDNFYHLSVEKKNT